MDDEDPDSSGNIATLPSSKPQLLNTEGPLDNELNHYKRDLEGILLEPNAEKGEIAVLNPGIPQTDTWPKPFVYRAELPLELKKRYSVIDLRWLSQNQKGLPIELTESQTIIAPEHDYETMGCEDPRITKIGDTNYITYVGFDGQNARVCLATTKDFKDIKKHGVISPQIPLELVIELVKDKDYKKYWEKELKNARDAGIKTPLFPMDKDAFLHKNGQWELFHRLGNYLQISRADNLEDFQKTEYWENQLRNIKDITVMKNKKPWINRKWASEKIGWGSQVLNIGDKDVVLLHGVELKNEEYKYYGTFLEIKGGKVVSIIKNPLFKPASNDGFEYYDNDELKTKLVIFPTAGIVDTEKRNLWVYSGSGDRQIKYYSTDIDWLYDELNQPSNRLDQ